MTHDEAQREMSVERYLLGELQENARDEFEDHLFDCELCSADLQAGIAFTEAIKTSGPRLVPRPVVSAVEQPSAVPVRKPVKTFSDWAGSLLQPWIAGPALAACMAVICVQSFVIQPRLHRQLAEADMPAVVNVMLLKGSTRGLDSTGEVQAHQGGSVYIALDIPAEARFRGYRCTLVSPAGKPVWHLDLSSAQVDDIVTIKVPVSSTASGMNVLKVEGLLPVGQAVPLVQRNFRLKIGE